MKTPYIDKRLSKFWSLWFERRASKNLKKWGEQDLRTLAMAVAEESGKLEQAVLQADYEGKPVARIAQEAVDLGALCLQVMLAVKKITNPGTIDRLIQFANVKKKERKPSGKGKVTLRGRSGKPLVKNGKIVRLPVKGAGK